jgi:hypothetical protein
LDNLLKRLIGVLLICYHAIIPPVVLAQGAPQGGQVPGNATQIQTQGQSLQPVLFSPTNGLVTNSAEILRDRNSATVLDNLEMFVHGIWTNQGVGWQQDRSAVFGGGAPICEMSYRIEDSIPPISGTNLTFQCGTNVYSYNTTTHVETQITGSLTPDPAFIPCMHQSWDGSLFYASNSTEPAGTYPTASFTPAAILTNYAPGSGGSQPYHGIFSGFPNDDNGIAAANTYDKPSLFEGFQQRTVWSGFQGVPNALEFSSYHSNMNWDEHAPPLATDAGVITIPSVLGPITGLHTFRLGNSDADTVLLVGCAKGVYMVTGYDGSTFQVHEVTRAFGIPSNRTWIDLGNAVYFLATDGVRCINNTSYGSPLITSALSFPIKDLTNQAIIDARAFAFHVPETQEIQFWFPIQSSPNIGPSGPIGPEGPRGPSMTVAQLGAPLYGSWKLVGSGVDPVTKVPVAAILYHPYAQCDHAIIMNYNTGSTPNPGSDFVPIWSTRSGTAMCCACTYFGKPMGGGYDGILRDLYTGDTYNGAPIAWTYVSPLIATDSIAQNASIRKFVICCEGADQNFIEEAYTYTQHSDGTTRRDQRTTSSVAVTAQTTYPDLTTWNTGGYAGGYPQFIDFAPSGSGRDWFIRLKGTTTSHKINLVGVMAVLTLGGWRQ